VARFGSSARPIFKARKERATKSTQLGSGPGTATPSPHPLRHKPPPLHRAARQCRPSALRPPPSSCRPLHTSSTPPSHLREVKRALPPAVAFLAGAELLMPPWFVCSWWFMQALCQQRLLPLPRPPSGRAHGSHRLRARAGVGSAPGLLRPVVSFNDLSLTVACVRHRKLESAIQPYKKAKSSLCIWCCLLSS
jgi:hypothetical protein